MARYQLWDIPSATMLDETDDPVSISKTVQALIDDEGLEYLDDLFMSEQIGDAQFASYTGSDVLLLRNHAAHARTN